MSALVLENPAEHDRFRVAHQDAGLQFTGVDGRNLPAQTGRNDFTHGVLFDFQLELYAVVRRNQGRNPQFEDGFFERDTRRA